MASTFSDLGIELMATGENAGTWGTKTNTNLQIVEKAISGYVEKAVTSGGTTALTITDGDATESTSVARHAVIKLTGTITGNSIVTVPDSIEKVYIVTNGTSGAYTVQFKTASGTGITFGVSEKTTRLVYSDGTNLVDAGFGGALDIEGRELVLDADGDTTITADTDDQIDIKIAGADDFQFTANTFTAQSGSTIAAQALTATTVTASGIVKTDDTTEATSTTDGSLQTDGGLSVAKDAVLGDDLKLLSDSAVLSFGADSDTTLTHTDGTGLTLNGANKLLFRDTGLTIGSNADGDLDIVSDGTAVDSINIESAGGITLDAGTAASGVVYEDDGTEMFRIFNSSSDVILQSKVSDKDLIIKGNDGGSDVTALTFDMSDAGKATFGGNVVVTGDLTVSGDDITMGTNTAGNLLVADGTNFNSIAAGSLSEISTVANDDVFIAVDTSGGGLKKIARSTIVAGLATSGAISNVVEDTSPQLGGNLDTNSQNILIDDAHFIADENGNEQIIFQTTSSAVNQFDITNAATGGAPLLSATGGDSNIDLEILAKGTGHVTIKGGTNSGAIQFNCESNSHGQIVIAQPHSAAVTNTLTLPAGASSTLVSLVSEDTLTNKTLTTPIIAEIDSGADITLDATADIVLDAAGGNVEFKDAGTLQLTLDMDGTAGAQVIKLEVDTDDLIFKQYDGTTVLTLDDDTTVKVATDLTVGDDLSLISDSAVLKFGADGDTTLTHTDGTGLTLNSTNKLCFNDATQFIQGASGTVLDIAATDEIELTATLIDVVGNLAGSGTGTFGGILKTDDATEATSTTDGSLQTDGGLSVVKDAIFGDDITLLSDAAVLKFGADAEVTLTHVHNDGLLLNADNQLQFRDSAINIRSDADGDLDINADDEVEINSTLIDVNGNLDVSGTLTQAGVATFSVAANVAQVALTSSSNAIAWDASAAANAYHITTENTTFSAPSNAVEGAFIAVEINYNGSHTIAFNTVFEFAASTAPTTTDTDGKTDILVFRYNGAVWQEVGRTLNLSES
jgi:hypothetical protein